jgi:Trp operon repressor
MPHISKKHLESEEFYKIYDELINIFDKASKKSKSELVLQEFFTRTEKVMFAKRFAVIVMLSKGLSTYEIANKLAMSPATTDRMSLKFEKGDYDSLVKLLASSGDIWERIELMLLTTGGLMPQIVGHKRVNELKKRIG